MVHGFYLALLSVLELLVLHLNIKFCSTDLLSSPSCSSLGVTLAFVEDGTVTCNEIVHLKEVNFSVFISIQFAIFVFCSYYCTMNIATCQVVAPELIDDLGVEEDHDDQRDDEENSGLQDTIDQSRVVTPEWNTVC